MLLFSQFSNRCAISGFFNIKYMLFASWEVHTVKTVTEVLKTLPEVIISLYASSQYSASILPCSWLLLSFHASHFILPGICLLPLNGILQSLDLCPRRTCPIGLPGGTPRKIVCRGGGCSPLLKTLNLVMTKICNFPCPIYLT